MSFIEILNSKYRYLVEAIEHGSSDVEYIKRCKKELLEKTGHKWID